MLYTRADIETGPPGLAVDRRPAAGLDLGPWQLRRARLVRGLAASRGDRRGSNITARGQTAREYAELPGAISRRGCARSCSRDSRANTYDREHPTRSRITADSAPRRLPRRQRTTKRCSAAIRRLLELRKAYAMKQGTVDDRGASARAHGVHLVVCLVDGHRSVRASTSATPTTGRTSRWWATRRRRIC